LLELVGGTNVDAVEKWSCVQPNDGLRIVLGACRAKIGDVTADHFGIEMHLACRPANDTLPSEHAANASDGLIQSVPRVDFI
jgi:hypothetical protein